MSNKVLVIGLDGGTFDILLPFARRGVMPHLAHLLQDACYGILRSTVPPVTAPAWTSLITGKNPGKHGIYNFTSLRPGSDREAREKGRELWPGNYSLLNSRSIPGKTLWQLLSEAGKRIGVVNVPMTYPPQAVNGFMICGMLTPPGRKDYFYPADLAPLLNGYQIDLDISEKRFDCPPEHIIQRVTQMTERRRDLCLQLMRERPWDFFMVVFTGTDRMQHRFWNSMDARHPAYAGSEAQAHVAAVEDYYRLVDRTVADLIAEAGSGTSVLIMSDHGFGPYSTRGVYINSLLRRIGVLQRGNWALRLKSFLRKRGINKQAIYAGLGRFLPERWLRIAEDKVAREEMQAWAGPDAAFVMLTEDICGLWITVEGEGEREATRERYMERLRNLVDPESGRRLIERVCTREELYTGPHVEEAPDIIFFLAPGYALTSGMGETTRLTGPKVMPFDMQGTHEPDGILILSGEPFTPGRFSRPHEIPDVTATVLYLLDVPVPANMDGVVVEEAFDPGYLHQYPVKVSEPDEGEESEGKEEPDSVWESSEDEENVLNRLRGIGYFS